MNTTIFIAKQHLNDLIACFITLKKVDQLSKKKKNTISDGHFQLSVDKEGNKYNQMN